MRQIFAWYIEGITAQEIRKRLIASNAPQKTATITRRMPWSVSSIQGILQGADDYAKGIKTQRREGESYQVKTDPILDLDTYRRFMDIKGRRIFPPTEIPKRDFLIRGLLYCPCGYRMSVHISTKSRKHWDGEWVSGKIYGDYMCVCKHQELISPDCPHTVNNQKADQNVWEQVCSAINHPELLMDQARILVNELKESVQLQGADKDLIEKELDNILIDRQWTITRARRGAISETEMEQQLTSMSIRQVELKKQLVAIQEGIDARLLVDWEKKIRQYFDDLKEGIEALNQMPDTPKEQLHICELKRQIIENLVEKIQVDRDRQFLVTIRLHMLEILESSIENKGGANGDGGYWPTISGGPQSSTSGRSSFFRSSKGQIRVSAIWTM